MRTAVRMVTAALMALGGAVVCVSALAQAGPARPASDNHGAAAPNPGVPWPATDALGRRLPTSEEVGPPKPGCFVGIFYFLTHNGDEARRPDAPGPYDVSDILARDPDALRKPDSPLWGPIGASHYWGEPLYGYYQSSDPWVLRRHAQLLADAGVDTLIFDTTNAVTYTPVYMKLLEVFRQVRAEGGRTPQVAFMVNTEAGKTAQKLYEELYKKGLYRELWFRWQGKPLMICDPAQASPEVKAFFTLRAAHWPFTLVNTPYAWQWEATYPQPYGYTDDPAAAEEVNVSVAQNLRASDGRVTNMSNLDARGRSFHDGRMDTAPGAVRRGYNFQEQWKRALALDPPFVMVTGWNEWTAGRWGQPHGPVVFVDQFDEEYSRDIEPMRGGHPGHGDDYYWQLVANVRRYKGAPLLPQASAPHSIRVEGDFTQWRDVAPEYRAEADQTGPRDYDGVAGLHYRDRSGRNAFAAFKVARDDRSVYFYARTRRPIQGLATGQTGLPDGLWLFIAAHKNVATNWEGFNYLVRRSQDDGRVWLERNAGGWSWTKVTPVACRAVGSELHLGIPRKALGLPAGRRISLDFKWADNLQRPGDVMDFYLSGDVQPAGRFRYRYEANPANQKG